MTRCHEASGRAAVTQTKLHIMLRYIIKVPERIQTSEIHAVAFYVGHGNNSKQAYSEYRALAHISRSALCSHSNAPRAAIANPPNSARLGSTLYHYPKLHTLPCSSVGMRRGTDRQTDTQTCVTTPLYISRRLRLARNVIKKLRIRA